MKELQHGSFLPESILKKSARFVAKKVVPLSVTTSLILAACGGEKTRNTQELENKESGYALPFPKGETWFLTTGPHGDGYSNGVRYAIDIAPPELGRLNGQCPTDGSRLVIDNRVVTASASGEVIAKGDDKNKNDLHHSEVRIKDKNGLTEIYIHLDNTKVKVGDKVKQGDPLGNPSCEYPPQGKNTGPHVHVGLMKDGQAIPIDGVEIGGWTIHNGVDGKDGTMTKDGEKTRTADIGRYGENSAGIRNDLPNSSNKAVVAGPKDPILPISATVKEAPKSTSSQSEGRISISKNPEDLYHTLASDSLKNGLPSGMSVIGNPTAVNPSEIHNNMAKMFGGDLQPFSGGTIFIQIDDERSNLVKGHGYPNVLLTLSVFTSSQDAQDAYNKNATQNEQTRAIKNFPYVAVIQGPTYSMYSGTAYIENVLVNFTIVGNDMKAAEQRTIDLMRAMPKVLRDAGN